MIPQSFIDAWRESAPWSSDLQVEQDLVVSRAVAELFADDDLHANTCQKKLFIVSPNTWSTAA